MKHSTVQEALNRKGYACIVLQPDGSENVYDSYMDGLDDQFGISASRPKTAQETGETRLKGWLQKYIEKNNGVTLSKLQGLMMDRGYTDQEIARQFKLIHQDYEIEDKVVLCLKSLK